MRLKLTVILFVVLSLVLTGCMDDRIRRQISLLNVKTTTARDEFNSASTADEKVAVAQTYFSDAPAMTQVIEDYAFSRQPAVVSTVTVGGTANAVKGVGHKLSHFFAGRHVEVIQN